MTERLYGPNLLAIGVDAIGSTDYSGRMWNAYQTEPEYFSNSMELLRMMEAFFDRINFPQSAVHYRSFQKEQRRGGPAVRAEDRKPVMSEIEKNRGDKGTFIVQVMYRQNATWQGQVIWAEQNKKVYFRSAMELLKLMDSALETGTIEQGEKISFPLPEGKKEDRDETEPK